MHARHLSKLLRHTTSALVLGLGLSALATPAQAVVARDDVGATAIRDTTNVWPYVGQMIDLGGPTYSGGFGLCTGSVIAPRVVMFAAHCVGGNVSGYEDTVGLGANNMAFSFNSRNLDAIRRHIGFDPSPQPIYQTNVADRYYRVVDVITHPRNADNGFEAGTADIALAVLDTPIDWFEGVPLLFSQPTATENIEIVGYGNQGTMSTGQISIDWWRRQGGNNLGFVGSDNDVFASDLFGNAPPFVGWDGANLWTDCDSHLVPRPGGDFNILGGSALANEVCVAQGDSGGAMWVTRGGQKVAVGVASYGYSFGPAFGHGSLVAHTALFPYWDFIVANNGYVYSNAKAGGGAWENPATWSQALNPNYFTSGAGGALVNSLPTTDPASTTGPFTRVGGVRPLPLNPVPNGLYVDLDGNDLGIDQAAFLQMGIDAAQQNNVAHGGTGNIVPGYSGPGNEGGEGGEGSQNPGNGGSFESPRGQDFIVATSASGGGSGLGGSGPVPAVGGVGSGFWPVGTTPLSGPNSTNFVPDNTNGVIGGAAARFYQVDHGNAGVLTLSSTRSVDRFRLLGASSTLQINGGAQLNSMMTSSQSAGTLINNGTFQARGLTVTGGRVQGNGTFNMASPITQFASTGFALNGGTLAPGNSIGITNIVGNYVQGAGGTLEIEVTNGSSDQVLITGTATLAGTVNFVTFGANPLKGQSFTFLNAAGGRSGTFTTVADNLTGLLFPVVSYTANTAVVTINASTFCSVAPSQPICSQLDSMDGTTTPAMQALIQGLQNIDITQISTALASVNPTMVNAQGHAALELGDLIKGQLGFRNVELLSAGPGGQQSAMLRAATQLASADASAELIMSAASAAVAQSASTLAAGSREGWGAFGSIDFSQADTRNVGGEDQSEANAMTAGIDYSSGKGWGGGAAVSLLDSEVSQNYGLGGETSVDGYSGSIYGGYAGSVVSIDAYASYGELDFSTSRRVMTGPMTFVTAFGNTSGTQMLAGATVNVAAVRKSAFLASVVGGMYYAGVEVDGYTEFGAGGWSFVVGGREHDSLRGQLGIEFSNRFERSWGAITPFARVQATSEFGDDTLGFTGAWSAAPATTFTVALPNLGHTWGTAALGISASVDDSLNFYARYQTDISREGQTVDQVSIAARIGF